jgi:hypothetical protein
VAEAWSCSLSDLVLVLALVICAFVVPRFTNKTPTFWISIFFCWVMSCFAGLTVCGVPPNARDPPAFWCGPGLGSYQLLLLARLIWLLLAYDVVLTGFCSDL